MPSAPNGRSYITYVFKNANDRVVYVGRASGQGNPIEVLNGRIAKGHEHFYRNLKAEVVAIQSSKPVSQGAEEFFIQGFREEGAKLTNIAEALDIIKPDRRIKSIMKLEAFFDEIAKW